MSPLSLLKFYQGPRLLPTRHSVRESRAARLTDQRSGRVSRRKEPIVSLPLLAQSLPCSTEFCWRPEEEVFALSLEEHLWESVPWEGGPEAVLQELEVDTATQVLEASHWTCLPSTPPALVIKSVENPSTPRRLEASVARTPRPVYVHNYKCEDVMEYAVDVFQWKKSLESVYSPGDWTRLQTEVSPSMRSSLLAWLAEVARQLEYSLETWCLAVNYLDRFLCRQLLSSDCLQLAGLVALWLATKQEEQDPPEAGTLVKLCAGTFTVTNFRHMEVILLSRLDFCLAAPTPSFLLAHMVEVSGEQDWCQDVCRHLLEVALQDQELASLPPSRIASCVFSVLKGSDQEVLRMVESSCPRCEPRTSDSRCRTALEDLHHRLATTLLS